MRNLQQTRITKPDYGWKRQATLNSSARGLIAQNIGAEAVFLHAQVLLTPALLKLVKTERVMMNDALRFIEC
jgi:hypothetical protein